MGPRKGKKRPSTSSSSESSSESSNDSSSSSDSGKKHSKSKQKVDPESKHKKGKVDSRKKTKASSPEERYETNKKHSNEKKSHKVEIPSAEDEKYDKRSKPVERRYEHRDHHDPRDHHEKSKDRRDDHYERSKDKRDDYHERSREQRDDRRKDDYHDKYDRGGRYGDRDRDNKNNRENYQRDRNRPYRNDGGRRGRRNDRYSPSFDHANAKWGRFDDRNIKTEKEPPQKDKPNFGLSGKLTEDTNTFRGVVIKYSEPPEARKPRRRWRLYPFKGEKALQTLYIHRESAYLIGRERKVVDLPVDHPSCSKQHAALQYRLVPFTRDDGSAGKRVRPYIIDLDSANGTFINNKKIDPRKYVELLEKDVIKFGFSSREYVLLHENSKDEAMDDDVKPEEEETTVKAEVKAELPADPE